MNEDDAPPGVTSIFGFSLSLALLGILLFFTVAHAAFTLATFTAMILVLMIALRLWGRISLWRLDIELSCDGNRLFPGETLTLNADIANRKVLPLWLRFELSRSEALSPVAADVGAETALLPFERMSGAWSFRALRRGLHQMGPAKAMAGDLLGMNQRTRTLGFRRDIVVFPRLVPIRDLELPFQDYFGIRPAKGIVEDPAWYEGTRDYSGNKPAKNIHWKASAHLNVLQEKIFEPTSHQKIFFLLDGEEFEKAEDPEGFESALEILGSLASRFAETGASFAVATDRIVRGFPAILPLGRGPEHLGLFLELLARCERWKGQNILSLLGCAGGASAAGAGFVVVARSMGASAGKYLALPAAKRDRVQFVLAADPDDAARIDCPCITFGDLLLSTALGATPEPGAPGGSTPGSGEER